MIVAGLMLSLSPAAGANAATTEPGTWYWDALHIQDAHDAGYTGKGVTIAVIDSPINPQVPTLVGANLVVTPSRCWDADGSLIPTTSTSLDPAGYDASHGTNVASLIVGTGAGYPGQTGVRGVAPDAKLLFYLGVPISGVASCFNKSGNESGSDVQAASITDAVRRGAQIISLSISGSSSSEIDYAIAKAEHAGVVLLFSYPNTSENILIGRAVMARSNGAITIGNSDSTGFVQPLDKADSGYTADIDVVGPGTDILTQGSPAAGWQAQSLERGTSFATPIVASFLAVVKQKYPKATGNQLIQTLINNTGTGNHPLVFNQSTGHGYGTASMTSMLKVDPAQYPDVNPLISNEPRFRPEAWLIANPISFEAYRKSNGIEPTAIAAATPSPTPKTDQSQSSAMGSVVLIGLVLGVTVVVVALAMGTIFFVKRRRQRHA